MTTKQEKEMATTKISDFYPWGSETLDRHAVLFLDEHIPGSNHTAEFLLTSLLLKFLTSKQKKKVVFLLCNHPPSHYESILRKNVSSCLMEVISALICCGDSSSTPAHTLTADC